MGLREELEKKIEKKHQEIRDLEEKIRDAKIYVQAFTDTLRLLPKHQPTETPTLSMRPGSLVDQARGKLREAGRPLHIQDILKAIGKPGDRLSRAGLGGSLSAYVRRKTIFTRPAPNTFGLVEWDSNATGNEEPPDTFGVEADVEGEA